MNVQKQLQNSHGKGVADKIIIAIKMILGKIQDIKQRFCIITF